MGKEEERRNEEEEKEKRMKLCNGRDINENA